MQIKVFSIPIPGGDQANEELNVFLRSKKVIQIEDQVISHEKGSYWCFYVKYLDEEPESKKQIKKKDKIDYREILDEPVFQRFSNMREIRKRVAEQDAVPAYAVFNNAELAVLAKIENLTPQAMKQVKGVSEIRIKKYGHHFTEKPEQDEKD